jgi:hypothetical protein
VRQICLHPRDEWIATIAEPGDARRLLTSYVALLAVLLPAAQLVAGALIGEGHVFLGTVSTYRTPFLPTLILAALTFAALVGSWIVLALVLNLLAPTFGARQDNDAAFKLAAYSMTPVWLAGGLAIVAGLHPSLHALWVLAMVAGACWSGFLLWVGLPIVLGTPEERALHHALSAALATAVAAGVGISVLNGVFGALLLGTPIPR